MASGQLSVSLSAAENSSEKDLRNSRTLLKPLQAFPSSTQQASPAKSKANIEIPILIVSSESDFGPGSPVRHVREAPFSVSALEEQSTPSFNADLGNREARSAVQSETGDKLLAAGLCHGAVDRPEPGKYAPPMSPAMSAGPMEGTSPRPGSEDLETRSEKELAHAEGKGDNIAQDEQLTGGIARNGTLSGRSPLHPDTKSSPLPISGVQDLSSAGKRGPLPDRTEIPLPPYNPPIAQRDAKRATSASGRNPVSREGTSAETHQGTSGGNEQTGSVQLSTTGEVLSSPEAPAGSGPEPNHAESAEKRPQSVEPESSPGGSITKAVSASDEPLQREPPPEVTGSGRAREADLQLGADKPSMPGLPVREQDRPQKITAGPEQRGGVQQQPATPPPAQAQPTGWGNGRAANGAWQGSPGGSGSQRGLKSVSQQGEGPSGGVQMRRPQSGGHGRGGWQPPGRYSPQGLGKGGGFQGSMNHNATSAPGTNNVRRNGAVDNGGGRQRGQSRSPESPLNWGKPVSPNLEELPVAMSQPPVPQPLPPTLAGGAATHLTIEWQESPRCQFYFLDMALSVDRGVRDTGSSVGNGERLVGESLDWRPVYSGKDFKCQVTGLKPGQSYWFRVRYLPAATPPFAPPTPPPPSMPAFFWTQCSTPGPPTPPQLASRARSNLKVKWAPPPETGGKPVTHYQLRMRPPPAREESWSADPDGFVEIYQGSDTSFKVARLVPGRDYAFRVRGFNSIGAGAFSPEAIFSTQPSVPAQPEAPQMVAQTATSVTLRWEAPHSGGAEITEYVLEIDDGEGGAFAMVYTGPEMICEIQQLRAGFTYRCRVLAVNEVGRSTFSIPADVRTGRAEPFKPTPPVISCRGPTSLTLAWDPPEDDGGAEVEEYRVEIWHPRGGGWRVAYVGPARACSVTNLQPGQSYRVRVQAANQVGLSEWSGELRAMTSASAPDSLEPPVLGDSHQTAVLVQWAPPRHDGGSAVAGYRLEMGEGGGRSESFGRGRTVYSGLDTAVWVKELQPGCAYSFRIQTWNKLGSSPWTPPVVFHTLPGNPSSPGPPTLAPSAAITMTSTQLPLVWEPPAANGAPVLSYCLQMCMPVLSGHDTWRGERAPRPALADSSSSTDLAETARSSSDAFKPPGSKTAPPSETASVGTGSVDEDTAFDPGSFSEGGDGDGLLGSPGEDGISRKGLAGRASEWGAREELRFEDVEVCAGAAATVGGLMPHTLYAFRVRATNTVGSSEFSPVSYLLTASAEPEAPPPPTVVETGPDHVHLRWEKPARDNGESVESYSLEIERRSSNRTASSSASPVGVRPSKQRGARMVGIGGSTAAAVAAASKGEELWEEVYSGNVRECLVDTLDPGRPYRFRVRAWNAVGGSPPSASVQVRTDPAAPGAPPPPSFSAVTPTTVRVRWTPPEEDNGAPVRSYKLGADDGLGGAFRQVYEGSALKHTAARLVPGRTYLFRVQAISELGASAPSAPASVSLPRAPPRAPLAPVAKSANTSALVLVWEAPESEEEEERFSSRTGFTLQLEERGTFKTIYEGEEPSFEAKNLAPGTVYRFRVRSNGPPDMDPGPWSPTAALATDALLDVAAPRAHKSPSRLQNQLRTRLHVLHQEADRWQGLPMRRAVASLCVALVLIAAFLQWG